MYKKVSEIKPPLNTPVETKLDDLYGIRNEQKLIYDGKLWWLEDKSRYIYYTPTHWK